MSAMEGNATVELWRVVSDEEGSSSDSGFDDHTDDGSSSHGGFGDDANDRSNQLDRHSSDHHSSGVSTHLPSGDESSDGPSSDGDGSTDTGSTDGSSHVPLILGITVPLILILIGAIVFFLRRRRAQSQKSEEWIEMNPQNARNTNALALWNAGPLSPLADPSNTEDTPTSPKFAYAAFMDTRSSGMTMRTTASSFASLRSSDIHQPPVNWSGAVLSSLEQNPVFTQQRLDLSQLTFEEQLSHGGFGEVWRCTYQERQIAVKRMLPHTRQQERSVRQFISEIELHASLNHPNIIKLEGVSWSQVDDLCMAMPYCATGDLSTLLKRFHQMMSWNVEKAHIALGVARGLDYLHDRATPIIHRDIKANNVLLADDHTPLIIDFGVSRDRVESTMTAEIGTPYWVAPEVLHGQRYSEKSDIYSFGVVLYELDTGRVPFSDIQRSGLQIMGMLLKGELEIQFSSQTPEAIRKLGEACLLKDERMRPSARQVVEILSQL